MGKPRVNSAQCGLRIIAKNSAYMGVNPQTGSHRQQVQRGCAEQTRIELATAIDLYRAMDMTLWLPQAEAALAQVRKM